MVADLWRFERDNNADGQVGNPLIDSNPVDVYAAHGRCWWPTPAATRCSKCQARGAHPPVACSRTSRRRPSGGEPPIIPMNAVPTGIVAGPDGAYYMSQLTGFPFPLGGAKSSGSTRGAARTTTYASGFTNAMDLDFGRDGTLYVLEIDHDSLLGPAKEERAPGGAPRRRHAKGRSAAGRTLIEPGGLAVGRQATSSCPTTAARPARERCCGSTSARRRSARGRRARAPRPRARSPTRGSSGSAGRSTGVSTRSSAAVGVHAPVEAHVRAAAGRVGQRPAAVAAQVARRPRPRSRAAARARTIRERVCRW